MTTLTLVKAQPISEIADPPLFVNLNSPGSSANGIFINLIRQRGPWRKTDLSGWPAENLDANGEIASLPAGVTSATADLYLAPVTTSTGRTGILIEGGGAYTFTWVGGPSTCTLSGITADSSGTRTVTFTMVNMGINIFAVFNNLDTLGLPTQLTLVKNSNLALYAAGEVFDPLFLAMLSNTKYAALRFMDWERTNNATIVNWSEKPTAAFKSWSNVPLSVSVDLCNKTGIAPYFCMPHTSNEDYWTQHATYVRDNLNPALTARYTWSNEVWNWGFAQTGAAQTAGAALFGTNDGNEYLHYYGYKMAELSRVLDGVYGSNRRYLMVFEAQAAGYGNATALLLASKWLAVDPDNYIAPHSVVDEISIAPYYANSVGGDAGIWTTFAASGEAAAVAYIDTLMPASLAGSKGWVSSWKAIADGYSLPLISYENGLHLELNTSHNANLYKTEFTVPDGNAYTVGERVTQTGTSATALVLSKTATGIVLDTEATPAFNSTGVLTGATSGQAQTPTALINYNPKDGVEALFEEASYSAAAGARYAEHMTNCRDAGMRYFNVFSDLRPFNKFGPWGLQRWHGDENPRKVAVDDWVTANPRNWPQINRRRAVTWP